MGPRIYPSFQDTNTTAKGSFILTLTNIYLNNIQVTVNGILRDVEYSNLNGYYTTNININDVVTILLTSTPNNYYKMLNVIRRDYTTDDVSGDYGIFDTLISNNNSFDTTGLTVTFTATTSNASYNFEYRISASVMAGTPGPTATPTPTPTPIPFIVRSGAIGGGINSIYVDSSDNVYIGGRFLDYDQTYPFSNVSQFTKLNPDGGIVSTYTQRGNFNTDIDSPDVNKILTAADGKIMLGGVFNNWFDNSPFPGPFLFTGSIVKMNNTSRSMYQGYPSSTLTGSSANKGFEINDLGQTFYDGYVFDIVQQSDGKFIIGGIFSRYSGQTRYSIIRINDNGTIDSSFTIGTGFNRVGSYPQNTLTSPIYTIKLQSDGKILVGGEFTQYNGFSNYGIIRLNSDGTRDTSFTSYFNGLVSAYEIKSIQIQPNDKILVAGTFKSYSGVTRQSILKLNSNGTLDTTFGSTSGFTGNINIDGFLYGRVNDMILQSDGKILCAGDFTGYSGVSSNNLIRLNNDGTIDTTFNTGTGFNGTVKKISLQSTGNIMCVGEFTTYNSNGPFNGIARVTSYGGNATLYIPPPTPTPTPSPTTSSTPAPTPTQSSTPTPTPTPTSTPVPPISATYRYVARSNWGASNTKTASNLCVIQNSVSNCVPNDTWNNNNNFAETLTGITVGTYPLTISRNLSQNTVFTSYTQNILNYTVEVLVDSVSVWSTGYTYSPALTIPVSPSVDAQSVITSGITLFGGENLEIIWTDNCSSPSFPTPTPSPTASSTPTPTPTSTPVVPTPTATPVVPTPTPGGPTPTPTSTPAPPTPTPTGLPSIITSGLTSYLNYTPPSYPGTGTTWTNIGLSGSTYNATLVASPTFTSGSPGFFDFNGTTQYATLPQAASGSTTGSYTLSAWVQVPTSVSGEVYITRGELAAPPTNYSLRLGKSTSNRFTAEAFTSGGFGIVGTTTINSSTWYNVTLRWISGTGLSLWVNGVKEAETLTSTTSLRTSTSVGWILMKNETTNYAPGKLSSVAMYFRNLSDAEILSNFNTLKSIYGY